jgi:hypothetical protein
LRILLLLLLCVGSEQKAEEDLDFRALAFYHALPPDATVPHRHVAKSWYKMSYSVYVFS